MDMLNAKLPLGLAVLESGLKGRWRCVEVNSAAQRGTAGVNAHSVQCRVSNDM